MSQHDPTWRAQLRGGAAGVSAIEPGLLPGQLEKLDD